MKSILVPISFSDHCRNSLRHANAIANETGATMTLLHCYTPQEFNRVYNFGALNYDHGIRKMLSSFYREAVDRRDFKPYKILTFADSISSVIGNISSRFDLLVMSRKTDFQSRSDEWFTRRLLYLKAKSSCPVLLLPNREELYSIDHISNVWHLRRKENDCDLAKTSLNSMSIRAKEISTKSFEQQSFTSIFWQNIVKYRKDHSAFTLKETADSLQNEHIDLLIVYYKPSVVDRILKEDPFQVLSQINIPIMVIPPK